MTAWINVVEQWLAERIEDLVSRYASATADEIHIVHRAMMDLYMVHFEDARACSILNKLRERGVLERWERASARRHNTTYSGMWDRHWRVFR